MNSKLMRDFESAPPPPSSKGLSQGCKLSDIKAPDRTALFLDNGIPGEARLCSFQPPYTGQPKAYASEFPGRHNRGGNIVFADADLEKAAAAAPYAVFDNAGQDCCARSRILVERSAYDRFVELLVEATRNVKVGDPQNEATEMGPLISAQHRETVASFVDGDPLFRGDTPDGRGFWFPCTLVEATNEDRVAREEVFGPVAALIPFADEDEAIRIANDTPYGLSGSIWTENGARALRVARALETGVLSINSNSSVRPSTPFGGFKQSGFGRELGMHAMDGYSEVKNVFMAT